MNAQIVINTLQKKISELTLINVMMEAQIQDLQSQLNSMKTEQQSENDLDGNENQTKEIDDNIGSPDDF
jgi:cell division protein FtsB